MAFPVENTLLVQNMLKVLIIGGGGREHALAWKLAQSKRVGSIYCAPGNGGTAHADKCRNLAIGTNPADFPEIAAAVKAHHIDFVVVGPDNPLADGLVDYLHTHCPDLKVFGPSKEQAKLEWSKAYAKEVMQKLGIPTARWAEAKTLSEAERLIKENSWARVVKADGLALGKGVFVCDSEAAALQAAATLFGDSQKVVLEERLSGPELSLLTLVDGKHLATLLPSQDHKRRFDNDLGPNTGGMGAYAPVELFNQNKAAIESQILEPLRKALADGHLDFKGVLFIGILMHEGEGRPAPYVLEFNARFGDPETQTILPLLESDLLEALLACCEGTLDQVELSWSSQASCCVIGAYKEYPEKSSRGETIKLSSEVESDQILFQAGTKIEEGRLITAGGRIFACVGLGANMNEARIKAYRLIETIDCANLDWRRDIAGREICLSK